jgi:adenosylhomocysteine nucleosidase
MRPGSTTARALLLVVALGLAALAAPADRAAGAAIAVLGALDAEVQPLLAALAAPQAVPVRGIPCVAGTIAGRRVLVAATGVGKVNAAMTTALVIERFSPAAVIFSGVAGALDPELQPGDVVIGERLVQHDLVNHTESGATLRSVRSPSSGAPGSIALEASPTLLMEVREAALGLELERAAGATRAPRVRFGTIATGDSFISSRAKKTQLRDELRAHAVEMEGAAVAQV